MHWASAISCAAVSPFYKTGLRISFIIKKNFKAIVCAAPSAKSKVSHLYSINHVFKLLFFSL